MNRQMLFDGLWDLVKESDVDFVEIYVGDEEDGQVSVRFENIKEADDGGDNGKPRRIL